MSIQSIINVCESLNINRRKVVGIQYTRNEIAKISSTPTRNPWKFTLNVTAGLEYTKVRSLLEQIDNLDRNTPETVSFSGVPGMNYIFAYQGAMTAPQIAAITVTSFSATSLVLGNLPSVASGTVLFKKGDLIQIADYPHPFTVTSDVTRGSSSTVTVTTHRGNFKTESVAGKGIVVGNACQFRVVCSNMPTYTLKPGGGSAIIEWSSPFELYEFTGETL